MSKWLVNYIEKSRRGKGIHIEAPARLREWGQRMTLHEIIDETDTTKIIIRHTGQ